MSDYQIFEMAWKNKWANEDQMKEAVFYKLITAEEYKQITNEDYSA
jgi:hypothetical protein